MSQALAIVLLSAVCPSRLVWGGWVMLGHVVQFGLAYTLFLARAAFQTSMITLARTLAYAFGHQLAKQI